MENTYRGGLGKRNWSQTQSFFQWWEAAIREKRCAGRKLLAPHRTEPPGNGPQDKPTFKEPDMPTHKIAAIPVSFFYDQGEDNKVLRFCFAKGNATLEAAGEILRSI